MAVPTVTTSSATSVGASDATLNGEITNTGGENADYRGFVWDTTSRGDPGNTAPSSSSYSSYWTEEGDPSTYYLDADASGDYIDCNAQIIPSSSDFTVSAWVRVPSSPSGNTHGMLFGNMDTYYLLYLYTSFGNANWSPRLYLNSEVFYSSTDLRGLGWKHIILERDGNDYTLYLDNTVEATGTSSTSWAAEETWFMGDNTTLDSTSRDSDADFDDIRVFHDILTSTERSTLASSTRYQEIGDEYLWYKLNDGTGSTVTDDGSGNNDGTINGNPSWTVYEEGGFGTGTFSHQITGLNYDTYYYRACAHNSDGWSYGSEVSFTTLAPASPAVVLTTNGVRDTT